MCRIENPEKEVRVLLEAPIARSFNGRTRVSYALSAGSTPAHATNTLLAQSVSAGGLYPPGPQFESERVYQRVRSTTVVQMPFKHTGEGSSPSGLSTGRILSIILFGRHNGSSRPKQKA